MESDRLFFVDTAEGEKVTWSQLIMDIHDAEYFKLCCYSKSFYEVFKNIVLSILSNQEVIMLDSDFSKDEINSLVSTTQLSKKMPVNKDLNQQINTKKGLLEQISKIGDEWNMTLFSSGTTGLPKSVKHNFNTLTRFVKRSENHSKNIWGFAYNPTHIAGIQVFLQALLNGNTIIRLFGHSKDEIYSIIKEYNITHVSATTTFYRLLLPTPNIYPSLQRITSGGEKFDDTVHEQLKIVFPNAKVTNVYASTEAGTLLGSDGKVFSVSPKLKQFIKVVNNELFIHISLLGKTAEEYGEWYPTGDLVEIVSTEPLQFLFAHRINEAINVGGYKVNPHEIEEYIRNIDGVIDVRVFSKKNSVVGNIVCCEIVKMKDSSINELLVRNILRTKVQEFKIPRIINFVDNLEVTRTGKIKRS